MPGAARRRRSARSPEGFYGWRIVAASSAAVVLTAPGQTAAVSASLALAGSMLLLAAGLLWGTVVEPGVSAIGFGLTMGAAGGSVRTLEAATVPKVFGTTHLGSIRGLVAAFSVGSTAFGPVLFAVVREATGSYRPVLVAAALLPLLVAAASLRVREPELPTPAAGASGRHG